MTDVIIKKLNDVYCKVISDTGIAQELSDLFTFMVPGAKFMPQVRNKFWDGKIRLFNMMNKTIYAGLTSEIVKFCELRSYTCEVDPDLQIQFSVDDDYLNDLIKELKVKHEPRDYQREAFIHAVNNNRSVLLSPTGSGKSLIIYLLTRHYMLENKRVLVVVPTTSLVHQMRSDFIDYNNGKDLDIHIIMSGHEKDTQSDITITTWQSIFKMPMEWFERFNVVIGDEAHLFKAKSLTDIMTKLVDCPHRFGFTGTLDGALTNKMILEGLFGPVHKVTSTKQLMDDEHLSTLSISVIRLKYTDEERKLLKGASYQDEIDWLVRHERRNDFITNMVKYGLKENTLVLFQYVDKHGKVLYDKISAAVGDKRKVYFIHGGVEAEEREQIRAIVEADSSAIIIASYGTFSTGVNIKNLHNVVFASPTKSRVRSLQSIGRGLRITDTKKTAKLYDFADDLIYKSHVNHTMKHFMERVKIYDEEKFDYVVINREL